MSIYALGGGDLAGDEAVLFVYLDESGTGNPRVEPWVVMAGVMIKAERKWKEVERYLKDLADGFAEPDDRGDFYFHANQLFTGGPKEFRDKYPLVKRHAALEALCNTPARFDLPIFMYGVNRADYALRRPGLSANDLLIEQLMHCSIACATQIEQFVKKNFDADEVVTLVYENNTDKNKGIRDYHHFFRSDFVEAELKKLKPRRLDRFERIIEAPMFSSKTDSSLLQLADTCAYVFNRKLRGIGIPDAMYRPVRRQLKAGLSRLIREAA